MASAFVDVPPISPSAVSMTGSRMPRLAASYFGLCTNQAPSTLTPCISKACWVSIRPPATPGVLLLIHWVICVQQWTPPAKWKWKLSPAFSGSRWVPFCCGILRLHILLSHFLAFDCFLEVLLIVKEQSVCLPFPPLLLYCDVCAAAATEQKKIFYKQTSGWRVFGEFNMYIIKYISLNLIFCFPVSFNT